jgi:Xaa-Pro aminopeptidase
MSINFSVIKQRRQQLLNAIKQTYPQKSGLILLFASFEPGRTRFRQDSSFYYYTGLEEPGVVLALDFSGETVLYVPAYGDARTKWVSSDVYTASKENLSAWGIDRIEKLGAACKGYEFSCLFSAQEYEQLIQLIQKNIAQDKTIFTIQPVANQIDQKLILEKLYTFVPGLTKHIQDIAPLVARARRVKSQAEIEALYAAVDCTMSAQEAASQLIKPDKFEYQVQAGIEFIFTESGARAAFPSIVGSGKQGTILHYKTNNNILKKGDLVVVDIGAELDYYCADITRTYPVSGMFTKRQRELYTLVLETQEYIADLAKPGMWLSNKTEPEQSLYHLAKKFLDKTGYGNYFTHGIGHYLGLDVHDVGDYSEPLQEGDVITIEPGIYIPEERLGIRIEDDYWIVKDGVMCLSQELPKEPELIEAMMAGVTDDDGE